MQVVYLGFFETLGEILSGIFNEILAPILLVVLKSLVPILIDAFKNLFAEIILELEIAILKIIDFMVAIFDIFSGVRYIKVSGQNYFILNYLINSDSLFTQVFWMITILSGGLCILFTMYTVAKSVSDGALGNEYNSMGKILGTSLKTMLMFLMIPAFMYFGISLCQTMLVYINDMLVKMAGVENQGIGTLIFLSCTLKAGRQTLGSVSFTDSLRIDYLNGKKQYYEMDQVLTDFDPLKVDLLMMLILELAVILILLGCIFVFVRRIFEIVVLYVTSPLFLSVMPLDNGTMFGKWRDMMFAKLVSCFAPVFGMRIFLMFVPHLMGSTITYSSDVTQDSLIKMFLIVGGCYAIYKSQFLLLEIISPEAAMQAKSNAMALVGMAMGGAGMVLGIAKAGAGAAGSMMKQRGAASKAQKQAAKSSKGKEVGSGEGKEKSQAFRGGSSSAGGASSSGFHTSPSKPAPKAPSASSESRTTSAAAPAASSSGGTTPAAAPAAPSGGGTTPAAAPAAPSGGSTASVPAPAAPSSGGSSPIPSTVPAAPSSDESVPAPAEAPQVSAPAPAPAEDETPESSGTSSDDPD